MGATPRLPLLRNTRQFGRRNCSFRILSQYLSGVREAISASGKRRKSAALAPTANSAAPGRAWIACLRFMTDFIMVHGGPLDLAQDRQVDTPSAARYRTPHLKLPSSSTLPAPL